MRLAALTLATALCTVSIPTGGMAFGNHIGWGGNHFGHRARAWQQLPTEYAICSPSRTASADEASKALSLLSGTTMRLVALTLTTALGLGTVSIPTVGMTDGRGDQFGRRHFHHHKTFIFPYAYDENEYPPDASGDYQPPSANVVLPPSSPSVCHRSEETFTVPSEGGGTRQITIINCP